MKQIFNHGEAMVFQMKRFTKKGQPVWINTQKTTTKELLELDHNKQSQQRTCLLQQADHIRSRRIDGSARG